MIKNPKPKSEIKRIERSMQQNPPKFLQKMKNPSNETANDKNPKPTSEIKRIKQLNKIKNHRNFFKIQICKSPKGSNNHR